MGKKIPIPVKDGIVYITFPEFQNFILGRPCPDFMRAKEENPTALSAATIELMPELEADCEERARKRRRRHMH